MPGLLLFVLLFVAGTVLAYRFSPASKLKRRMWEALSPFEELDTELKDLRQNLLAEIELSSNQYVQGIQGERLKAISLDELKKHATGMRLQALKDVGICSVADLQGWNEYRVSQVRGVGPKSASAIVQAVDKITLATKSIPIDHPVPPFSSDAGRRTVQSLYRQRWFDTHIAEHVDKFAKNLATHQSTRDEVIAKTSFSRWLWKFGSNETIHHNIDKANALIGALEEESSRSLRDKLSMSLNDCRTICANRVPAESIIQDFSENLEFYDSWLTRQIGRSAGNIATKPTQKQEAATASAAPDLAHVEFGRMVPGPPPLPLAESREGQASSRAQMQGPERLISVSVGSKAWEQPTEFTLPVAPRAVKSKELRWLGRGEPIQVQGRTLPCGFVYVGKGTNFEQYYALDPLLSATVGMAIPPDVIGYYFNYATLNPEQRASYLDWLAAGASSLTEPGLGMLYFYGLERRVLDLIQGNVSNPPEQELEQLVDEIHRLRLLFQEKPGSVTHCCLRLADFAAARALGGVTVPDLPRAWERTFELPFIMRYGLGCFMRDGKPIPMEWALRWAYVEPTIYLRTPATRCPQEFEAAFASVYKEKFGDGLVVPANKTKLKLAYQPGWPMHLEPEIKYEFSGIPDVAALSSPQQTLKEIIEQSTTAIDGYSRYLGRNTAKAGTLEAFLNLPLRFWPSTECERWQAFLTSIVAPIEPVTLEALLRELGYVGDPPSAKITEIVTNLNHALVGFEPDVLSGARRPKPAEMIVLFPLTSESTSDRTTDEYKKASLTVSLSACVALADGHASPEEAAAVEAMIGSWKHLHVDQCTRLRAQYQLQVRQGTSLASFKSRFANLTLEGRMQLALALSSLATVDGNIAPSEVKLLEQVYRALGLDPQLLYSHLYGSGHYAHGVESLEPSQSSQNHAYTLDASRLAAIRQETEQVSALLAGVFVEEEKPNEAPTQVTGPISYSVLHPQDELLPGLDAKHQRFLAEILQRPSWTRSELVGTAAKMQIMLDGALERINEAAFDLVGEPITEGDDPVYVQQNILEDAK